MIAGELDEAISKLEDRLDEIESRKFRPLDESVSFVYGVQEGADLGMTRAMKGATGGIVKGETN